MTPLKVCGVFFVLIKYIRERGKVYDQAIPSPIHSRLNISPATTPLSTLDQWTFSFHSIRPLLPGAEDALAILHSKGDIYGNTGRGYHTSWMETTQNTFKRAGVDHLFEDIFYTPEGWSGTVSKIASIAPFRGNYKSLYYLEDNPLTALTLARYFPDVTVYI